MRGPSRGRSAGGGFGGRRAFAVHEFSVVEELFRALEGIVVRERLSSVERVRLQVGELRQIVPELMCFAFDAAKSGTVCEGATLELETVAAAYRCADCGAELDAPAAGRRCPSCGGLELSVLRGREIEIVAIEGERE